MASSQILVRTPMEAMQANLEDEKVAHRQCQRRLEMMQRKNEALEQRLAEEARSHQYFKSRLAKAKHATPRVDVEPMLVEIAALSAEKGSWLQEKQSLLAQQECLTMKVGKYSKDCETATSCRLALMSALNQSQKDVDTAKDELRRQQAELRATQGQPRIPECTICCETTVGVVFGPCGHACVCERCADLALDGCPLCRGIINTKMKLHFA